jgi:hypothetical protein
MNASGTAASTAPRWRRILIWLWLGFQVLLLAGILATHGRGMEPDLRMLSGAAMMLGSFPLSIGSLAVTLVGIEKFDVQGYLQAALINWSGCVAAGVVQWWLLKAAVRWLAVRARGNP